jgi:SAM-dependent methyltransferase
MTGERPDTPAEAIEGGAVLFTSGAYDADADEAVAKVAAAWLEEQAIQPFLREVAERTLAALDLGTGDRVLDVGCGTGVFLPRLAAAVGPSGAVVGLDHSTAFLGQAGERIERLDLGRTVSLVTGDAHHLPFDDASFDAAHTERVLMHLDDPDRAIRELVRVVRPGGRIASAEIHAAGAAVDHPDHETVERMARVLIANLRNPYAGLELRGRFIRAGVTGVHTAIVPGVEEELDPDEAVELRELAGRLGDEGVLDRARAEAVVDGLIAANQRGEHCGYALMFVVSGTVPGPT